MSLSKSKKYEEAAKLRDDETHRKELAIAQEQWEEDAKNNESKLQRQCCRCSIDDWNSVNHRIANRK
jgi:hypothetical protein